MKIAQFSVKNSLFVNLLSVAIIVFGFFSLFNLRREAFPPIALNIVTVVTPFRGTSAEKVEKLVTVPLEKELKEVENIEEILSSSDDGLSTILIKVESDVRNMQKVVNDIQRAVDRVTDLPQDVTDRPIVTEITMAKMPVIKISLSGDVEESTLRQYADELRDVLSDIEGVSTVARSGWRDEEFWVEPDIENMREYNISFSEMAESLRLQNVDIPGGKFKYRGKEYLVKVKGELETKENIENTVIRSDDLGNLVRVKDVARVKGAFSEEETITKVFGMRSIVLTVIKRETGDIIKIVDAVRKEIKQFEKEIPENLRIAVFNDISYYVNRRLSVLSTNGIIGFIFVMILLFLFLKPASALMTALGIPISFLITFMVMSYFGLTINLLTLMGLIIVLGIVVDDGIIIAENSYRYIEQGIHPREAVVKGAGEVARPVIATVLTSIVAFSPLLFMRGMIGNFAKYVPLIIIIALAASITEAFIILPSHLADFARPVRQHSGKEKGKWFKWVLNKYTVILRKAINNRYKVLLSVIILLIGSFLLARFFIPLILFPATADEVFMIRLEARTDVSLEKTNILIGNVEKIVDGIPITCLDAYETFVGKIGEEGAYDPAAKNGSNFAQINVYLTSACTRKETVQNIIEGLRPKIESLTEELKPQGVEKIYFERLTSGPPVGSAIDARVVGEEFGTLKKITDRIKTFISKIDGVVDVADNYNLGAEEIQVIIDEKQAQRAFLTNSQIAFAIRAAFSGVVATTIKRETAEKEIRVLVRLPEEQKSDPSIFDKIVVANRFNNLIPLKKVAKLNYTQRLRSIKHVDGKRFISVTADVDTKNITSLEANKRVDEEFKDIPVQYPGNSLAFSGERKETMDSVRSLFKAFLIAAILIYLILATQFNSLIQPFVVMFTIPFGLIGVLIALVIHSEPLSFLAMVGFIGLSGVVVNDSIVLVDFVNKRRGRMSIQDAVIEAARLRFRPIMLTTLTTVCGIATVAYGIGGLDPFLRPMALAIGWGLMFSTGLTLIVIPCFYFISQDIKRIKKSE
ncbi:AcrB/AcrD/AcrF family protein [bacterium]|nr:AcrB/AcrD/AcrF family protein [bacterium]NIN92712.1 AcrB/AcrD/AcrF family protein [bacterium]NIO18693.1 AcrB/AcrD/AcrF family protein [bacterium]NIO73769.1 AcrB/AcrD/AcrF family protein [bacterium]